MGLLSFFSKDKKQELDKGLSKTKESFFSKLTKVVVQKLILKFLIILKKCLFLLMLELKLP